MTHTTHKVFSLLVAGSALLVLAGCSTSTEPGAQTAVESTETVLASKTVTFQDGWVKASDGMMTSLFGTLNNAGATEVNFASAECAVASTVELHETKPAEDGAPKMSPKEGGFVIEAGSSLALEPGGDHVMLMGLTAPIVSGDTINCLLRFSDASSITIEVPAKDFSGGNEEYVGGGHMNGMDHGGGN